VLYLPDGPSAAGELGFSMRVSVSRATKDKVDFQKLVMVVGGVVYTSDFMLEIAEEFLFRIYAFW